MVRTEIYWIDGDNKGMAGRLAIMPRPRGKEWLADEIAAWRDSGLNIIVSLLEADEVSELGLSEEDVLCRQAGLEYLSFPLVDRGVPTSLSRTTQLVALLGDKMTRGHSIGIHCRVGIGRSALIAACVLFKLGSAATDLFARISKARGLTCPDTDMQRQWFDDFSRSKR